MKNSKPKLWKRIFFGLIAFIFAMSIFVGTVFLRTNNLKKEASHLTESDFLKEEVVIDSVFIEYFYRMPIPKSLRYLYEPNFAEITFSTKDTPIFFRSPHFVPKSASLGGSEYRNLKLKQGDTITIIYKKKALEEAKSPSFLSKFYHRYKIPLVYTMSTKNGKLYDVGLDYDKYIDDKIHNESFFYLIILLTIISIAFVGFKFKLIRQQDLI